MFLFLVVVIMEVQDLIIGEKDLKGIIFVIVLIILEFDNIIVSEGKDLKGIVFVFIMVIMEVDFLIVNGCKGIEYEVLGNGLNKDDEKGLEEIGNGIVKLQIFKLIFNYVKVIGM